VLESVCDEPTHTADKPEIAAGNAFTVTVAVAALPQPVLYVITAVPAATLVTTPVVEPTVATLPLPLVHVPYDIALPRVVADPWHIANEPVIAVGAIFTVTTAVAVQPPFI
jgi:hypothetical protein